MEKKYFPYWYIFAVFVFKGVNLHISDTETEKKATKRQIIFGTSLAGSILLRLFVNIWR